MSPAWVGRRQHSSRLKSGRQDVLAALTQAASRGRRVAAAARAAGGTGGDGSDAEDRVFADHSTCKGRSHNTQTMSQFVTLLPEVHLFLASTQQKVGISERHFWPTPRIM